MAVVLVVAKLAADGALSQNHIAGIRVPATLASDAAWQQGHRAAITPAVDPLLLVAEPTRRSSAGTPAESHRRGGATRFR